MNKIKIGISTGDLNGIGPEIIIKTFSQPHIMRACIPVIYGSSKVMAYYKNISKDVHFSFINVKNAQNASPSKVNIVNCAEDNLKIEIGKASKESGTFAKMCLAGMMEDVKAGFLDAIVTAPINKYAMQLADFDYPGHTEYLAKTFDTKDTLMFMISENIKVGLVSGHVPIRDVADKVKKQAIDAKLKVLHDSLKVDFGIEKPMIGVLGLNPHAGDGGKIGVEDEEEVKPAIIEAKKKGILAFGPYAADGFFGSSNYAKMDGILAMYHDQGLVPFKTISFGSGVNFTAGLPLVRTSPDHGTAYDIAGKNEADPHSFMHAVYAAIDITRNRKEYKKFGENSIKKKPKRDLEVTE